MPSFRFAILDLMILGAASNECIAEAMEFETCEWTKRYPIPIMVSAFDKKGDLVNLENVRQCSHLMAFIENEKLSLYWELLKDEVIPDVALKKSHLLATYKNINYTTSGELQRTAARNLVGKKIGWFIVFLWAVIIPVAVTTIEFFSPEWVAVIVFFYSLYQAYVKAMKLLGKTPKTPQELAKEEEERTMRHHHYHCEQNPEAFQKLKFENFEQDSIDRIKKESVEVKGGGS